MHEMTNRVINGLLSAALNDDDILSTILIEYEKTAVEAEKIIAKLREER